jgi:hypothetical protein
MRTIHHAPRPFDSAGAAVIGVADAAGAGVIAFFRGVSLTFGGCFAGCRAATGWTASSATAAGFGSSFAGAVVSSAAAGFTACVAQPASAKRAVGMRIEISHRLNTSNLASDRSTARSRSSSSG